jgi:hypothetical protein
VNAVPLVRTPCTFSIVVAALPLLRTSTASISRSKPGSGGPMSGLLTAMLICPRPDGVHPRPAQVCLDPWAAVAEQHPLLNQRYRARDRTEEGSAQRQRLVCIHRQEHPPPPTRLPGASRR